MKRVLAITVLIFIISSSAMGASGEAPANWTEATPESLAEAGLDLIVKGDCALAAQKIFECGDPKFWSEDKIQAVGRQFAAQLPSYGKLYRYELVDKKELGESFVRLKYFMITDMTPVVLSFRYYKPQGEWMIIGLDFSDKKENYFN